MAFKINFDLRFGIFGLKSLWQQSYRSLGDFCGLFFNFVRRSGRNGQLLDLLGFAAGKHTFHSLFTDLLEESDDSRLIFHSYPGSTSSLPIEWLIVMLMQKLFSSSLKVYWFVHNHHTGPQEKINPKKSCRTNGCVWAVRTCLGNIPEAILTFYEEVHILLVDSLMLYESVNDLHDTL